MLVGKIDKENTIKLLKVRYSISEKNIAVVLGVLFFLLLSSTASSLSMILREGDQVRHISFPSFSNSFFFIAVVGTFFNMILYRTNNNYYSVFPQSNSSRFLSYQILIYGGNLALAIALMICYLIQYGIIKAIASFRNGIFLMYQFNLEFLIVGLVVNLTYAFLLISIVSLASVLIQRYKLYAGLTLVALVAIFISNPSMFIQYIPRALGFLIYEESVGLFLLKGTGLWIVILYLSIVINKNTVYYRTEGFLSKAKIAIAVSLLILFAAIVTSVLTFTAFSRNTEHRQISTREDFVQFGTEIKFDVSSYESGSEIEVYYNRDTIEKMQRSNMYLNYNEEMNHGPSGTLSVYYHFPINNYSKHDVTKYMNPEVKARLEGNRLYIDYLFNKNVKVVSLEPWSMMWQFERYRGKGIFKESFGSSAGHGTGNITIVLPQDKNFKIYGGK